MSYQPAVYRKQGGDELVIASSGKLNLESGSTATFAGTHAIASGGTLTIESGGEINVDSGGTLSLDSGAIAYAKAQTLAVADAATAVTKTGVTFLVGSTTGPIYTLATPPVAGYAKDIAMMASSSGVTHRAVLFSGSTGYTFGNVVGDQGNTLTFATSTCHGIRLVASSSTAWRVIGFWPVAPAFSNKST